jgi:predicted Fe-Mo cluster-binding NifX family protein
MILALPLTENDEFSLHFGGSAKIGLFEVDLERRAISRSSVVVPSESGPCGWADWLGAQGVTLLLAGGMGGGARQRMAAVGIEVLVGVPAADPTALVQAWLDGRLQPGANACGGEGSHHGHSHGHHQHDDHQHPGSCGCAD